MQKRLLMSLLMVAAFSLGAMASAADIHTLVCVDEANGSLIFADGSIYKFADRECKKLCPKGLPVSCRILQISEVSTDPNFTCCEISNPVTNESVLAVRVDTAEFRK